jgi:hypothetical protein
MNKRAFACLMAATFFVIVFGCLFSLLWISGGIPID